jgi:DNA-binding Lrp family transcriptional regulator
MGACPLVSARCKAPVSPRGVIGRRKELEAASIIADYVALLGTKKLSLAVKALGSIKLTRMTDTQRKITRIGSQQAAIIMCYLMGLHILACAQSTNARTDYSQP